MAETFPNTLVYREEWVEKVQERLDNNTNWKEICNVEYTNTRVLHNPYLTDPSVQTVNRGSSYSMQQIVETDDSVTISTFRIIAQFIDRADMAQSTFLKQMNMADRQGQLLNEAIETAVYANHAALTDFDNASIGGAAGSITVSVTNIDDIIRGIKREIREANGDGLLQRNGGFIVWRPADFELLEAFIQANGFQTSDSSLKDGSMPGINYMGMKHYASNLLTATHLIAGVSKVYHLGILKDTYGQIMVNDKDPGQTSGISVVSRVDFKEKAWNKTVPVLFDVNVA